MQLAVTVQDGSPGAETLVLLHGLGANGAVWESLLDVLGDRWPGRIVIPDLRGHGRSAPGQRYGLGQHAADVAELVRPDERVWIVGHSLGGAIGVALAGGTFGVDINGALALSVKPAFTPDELAKARAFAAKPSRRFATRAEAAERFLAANALAGLVAADSAVVTAGIVADEDAYRLAADPRTVLTASPPLAPMLRAAIAPVRLATGERDALAAPRALRECGDVIVIPGAGHNVHVERPEIVAQLAFDLLGACVA